MKKDKQTDKLRELKYFDEEYFARRLLTASVPCPGRTRGDTTWLSRRLSASPPRVSPETSQGTRWVRATSQEIRESHVAQLYRYLPAREHPLGLLARWVVIHEMVKCNENKFLTGKQVTDVVYKYFTILLYYSLKIIVVTKKWKQELFFSRSSLSVTYYR